MHPAFVFQPERLDAPQPGPLHGMRLGVKDTIDVAGWPTVANCRLYQGRVATADAAIVARLRALGAVPVAKLATWELGAGTGEVQEAALAPPPPHPFAAGAFVGGSSTGSGVAVSLGLVDIALGADTGGSVRCPAASCGVAGLKPTHGWLPEAGAIAHAPLLDHIGLLAPCAADLLPVVAALGAPASALPDRPRLALIAGWHDRAEAPIAAAFDAACARLEAAGARLARQSAPIAVAAARDLVRRIGLPESSARHQAVLQAPPGQVSEGLRRWLAPGAMVSRADQVAAIRRRDALALAVDAMLERHDAILCAGHARLLPNADDEAGCVAYCLESPNCVFNLTGHPALSVPAGSDARGRPVGLQLVGRRGEELALLHLAGWFEQPVPAASARPAFASLG